MLPGATVGIVDADTGRSAAARRGFAKRAARIERAEVHFLDVLAGPGEEDINDRQRSIELLLLRNRSSSLW